ncbi:MAG: glutamate 5-kinase [Desulfuromonadales bacterium]
MRDKLLHGVRRVVIKIGSGVISTDQGLDVIQVGAISDQICELLADGLEVVVVSSGAVAAGKGALGIEGKPRTIPLKQAAAAIGQSRVIRTYKEAFGEKDRLVAQVLLTRDDLNNRRRYLNARNTLMTLLEHRVTPIINENDTVVVEEIRFGDNDNLSAMVTNLADADLLIILSDVDGLYDSDPFADPRARLIPRVEAVDDAIEKMADGSGSRLGTGGMLTKVRAARRAAEFGVGTILVNGRTPRILQRIFSGEEVGTFFSPHRQRLAAKKHWISFTRPKGVLFLDDGACQALLEGGKSLLPSGVKKIEGVFQRGDAVRLCSLAGVEIAKGVIGYDLTEMMKIMGRNSTEIEGLLGYKYGDEVVHRDNMVLKNKILNS